jgi:hypothetical protein
MPKITSSNLVEDTNYAWVVEMGYTPVLETDAARIEGSTPSPSTNLLPMGNARVF